MSIKSYDPWADKTTVMPYGCFVEEISTKDWLSRINFEVVNSDYYVMSVESVEDLGNNEVKCYGPVYKWAFEVNRDKTLRYSDIVGEGWDDGCVKCEKKLYGAAPEVKVGDTLFLGLGDIYVVEVDVK